MNRFFFGQDQLDEMNLMKIKALAGVLKDPANWILQKGEDGKPNHVWINTDLQSPMEFGRTILECLGQDPGESPDLKPINLKL